MSMEMEGNGDMASEAADWFSQAFRLQLCGKQLDSKGAKNLLIGACVLLLLSRMRAPARVVAPRRAAI